MTDHEKIVIQRNNIGIRRKHFFWLESSAISKKTVNPAQETPISLESGAIFENTLNPAQEVFPQPPDPRNNPNRCTFDARTCVGQCASSRASARPAAGPRTSLDVLLLPSSNALLPRAARSTGPGFRALPVVVAVRPASWGPKTLLPMH